MPQRARQSRPRDQGIRYYTAAIIRGISNYRNVNCLISEYVCMVPNLCMGCFALIERRDQVRRSKGKGKYRQISPIMHTSISVNISSCIGIHIPALVWI
jgi:hypothetical protein